MAADPSVVAPVSPVASAPAKAPTWDEVKALPQMRELSSADMEAARAAYFEDVVKPQIPKEDHAAAWDAFEVDTRPAATERLARNARHAGKGLAAAAEFVGERIGEMPRKWGAAAAPVFEAAEQAKATERETTAALRPVGEALGGGLQRAAGRVADLAGDGGPAGRLAPAGRAKDSPPTGAGGGYQRTGALGGLGSKTERVKPWLLDVLDAAAADSPYQVVVTPKGGFRPGDSRQHGEGDAVDVQLIDKATGKPVPNYQDAKAFRVYEEFAQKARAAQRRLYPEMDNAFRWGGYFSGGKGKYGAVDLMHFDAGGADGLGMLGGSWESGLTEAQRRQFPGVESRGMDAGSPRGAAFAGNVTRAERAREAVQFFIGKGLSEIDAAGLVGNLWQESQLDPNARNGSHFGLAQWSEDRQRGMKGRDFRSQLEHLWSELQGPEARALRVASGAGSIEESARRWRESLFRPLPPEARDDKRAEFGVQALGYSKRAPSELAGMPIQPAEVDRLTAQFEAATPEQRQAMAADTSYRGRVWRTLAGEYDRVEPLAQWSPLLRAMGGRLEDRVLSYIGQAPGMDPKEATRRALFDIVTQRPSDLGDTIGSTEFDFERAAGLRGAGPGRRGLEQGLTLLGNQAAGLHLMAADLAAELGVPGAEAYGAAQSKARDRLYLRELEMGEAPNDFNRNLEGAIASTLSNAPALAVGLFSGGSAVPLMGMGLQVMGDEYAAGVRAGLDKAESAERAALFGAAEILGEKLGFRDQVDLLKRAAGGNLQEFERQFAKTMAEQVAGEQLTTAAQFGTDKLPGIGLHPEASAADYLQQVKDTLAQTVMQTAIMGAPGGVRAGFDQARESARNAVDPRFYATEEERAALRGMDPERAAGGGRPRTSGPAGAGLSGLESPPTGTAAGAEFGGAAADWLAPDRVVTTQEDINALGSGGVFAGNAGDAAAGVAGGAGGDSAAAGGQRGAGGAVAGAGRGGAGAGVGGLGDEPAGGGAGSGESALAGGGGEGAVATPGWMLPYQDWEQAELATMERVNQGVPGDVVRRRQRIDDIREMLKRRMTPQERARLKAEKELEEFNIANNLNSEPLTRERLDITPARHRRIVEGAMGRGEAVPPEVLADYPDLKAQYEETQVPAERVGGEPSAAEDSGTGGAEGEAAAGAAALPAGLPEDLTDEERAALAAIEAGGEKVYAPEPVEPGNRGQRKGRVKTPEAVDALVQSGDVINEKSGRPFETYEAAAKIKSARGLKGKVVNLAHRAWVIRPEADRGGVPGLKAEDKQSGAVLVGGIPWVDRFEQEADESRKTDVLRYVLKRTRDPLVLDQILGKVDPAWPEAGNVANDVLRNPGATDELKARAQALYDASFTAKEGAAPESEASGPADAGLSGLEGSSGRSPDDRLRLGSPPTVKGGKAPLAPAEKGVRVGWSVLEAGSGRRLFRFDAGAPARYGVVVETDGRAYIASVQKDAGEAAGERWKPLARNAFEGTVADAMAEVERRVETMRTRAGQRPSGQAAPAGRAEDSPPTSGGGLKPGETVDAETGEITGTVDAAAHEAAASPENDRPEPTEAQKEAGNYAKGHMRLNGLDLSIENPAGSVRSGVDQDGETWNVTMKAHYGYVRGSVGRDKDHVDVFVKPGTPLDYDGPVFVVDQIDRRKSSGRLFDEHKAMIGWGEARDAWLAYHENYAEGWRGAGDISRFDWVEFKRWVKNAEETRVPASGAALYERSDQRYQEYGPHVKAPKGAGAKAPGGETAANPTEKTDGERLQGQGQGPREVAAVPAAGVEPAANPFAAFDAVAREYGFTVAADGRISTEAGQETKVFVERKKGRLRLVNRGPNGSLLASYADQPEKLADFLRSYWYAEKKPEAGGTAGGAAAGSLPTPRPGRMDAPAGVEPEASGPADAGLSGLESPPTAEAAAPESAEKAKAREDLKAALADLGQVFLDSGLFSQKMMPAPEIDEAKLLPVMARVMDAAFRLGYHKFKDAARFVLEQVRENFGDKPADALTLDHLQGAYIAMAGKYQGQGADTKKAVVAVESLGEIFAKAADAASEGGAEVSVLVGGFPAAGIFEVPFGRLEFNEADAIVPPGMMEEATLNAGEVPATEVQDGRGERGPAAAAGDGAGVAGVPAVGAGEGGGVPGGRGRAAGEGGAAGGSDPVLDGVPPADGAAPEGSRPVGGSGVRAGLPQEQGGGRKSRKRPRVAGQSGDGGTGVAADGAGESGGVDAEGNVTPETRAQVDGGNQARLGNYHLTDPKAIVGGGPKQRFGRNRKAIETYLMLVEENRPATEEERDALAAYTGWGSFGQELFQGSWDRPVYRDGWKEENDWLRGHLGESAWKSAQDSILNAHYTDPPTVTAMWDMARRLGFKGGRVLEPSVGIGNFFGLMPRDLMEKSDLTGIELDEMTAGMARFLYPDANIQRKGYQESQTADDFYDLVIGNWPFAAQGPSDRRYNKYNATLHDYFFLKALDQVRPGGLVLGITSNGTMDKQGQLVRLALSKKASLIGAFRMPTGAFQDYAGTKVVADILIFQKTGDGVKPVGLPPGSWLSAGAVLGQRPDGSDVKVNEFWMDRRMDVLGTMTVGSGTTTGRAGMIVNPPEQAGEMERLIAGAIERLPQDIMTPRTLGANVRYVVNSTRERQNAVVEGEDGGLYVVQGERLGALEDLAAYRVKSAKDTAKREAQVRALIGLRRAYGRLIDAERAGAEESEDRRAELRGQYQAFVRDHGPINGSWGLKILRKANDPHVPTLAALERKTAEGDFEPAAILSRPTMRVKSAGDDLSIIDAFVVQRNESTVVDLARVAKLANVSEQAVEAELLGKGAVFRTPGGSYEVRDVYLSGNVRRKLREAVDAQDAGQDMAANIAALKEVLPPDVPYFAIEAKLGAPWVSTDYLRQFIADLLGVTDPAEVAEIEIDNPNGWRVQLPGWMNARPEANNLWGHPHYKAVFSRLLTHALNNTSMTIREKDADGNEVVNDDATKQVAEKIAAIREEFSQWAWRDVERRMVFESAYNEIMNAIADPQFDGSFLGFEGMALERGESAFGLRQHQVDAIWRGIANGRGIYAHEVGTGKTYTMGGIAVESRRYGIARKPLILAHNANSASVAREIQEMYPAAKVLYVDNLTPAAVPTVMRQIANDDWDAIVVPHSLVDRFALSGETLDAMVAEEIAEIEQAALDAAAEDNVNLTLGMMDDEDQMKKLRSVTAKELVRMRNAVKKKVAEMAEKASRPDAITFEELGIDMILVDEVHEFKKPPLPTRMKVKGLNKASSNRSITLRFLTDYVRSINGGRGVHIFTGTPITNTLNEIYNQMRYVMNEDMQRDGVGDWDGWFNTFAEAAADVELSDTGEYEAITRLAKFVNVAELRRMAGQFMHIVFADEMPEFKPRETASGKTLHDASLADAEREELLTGRAENPIGRPYKKIVNDVADPTPGQTRIRERLKRLAQEFKAADKRQRKKWVSAGNIRVPAQVGNAAAMAGLDERLYDITAADDPNNKVNRTVKNLMTHYREHPAATQVVFVEAGYSDSAERVVRDPDGDAVRPGPGLPSLKERVPTFNLVKDLVEKLVAQGVKREEIAVVSGTTSKEKRKEIADKMNRSEIRVVIGNTDTLGVGVNMQRNLRAMHHMDAPWMPGELEQRNGRGHRQGNTWNTVYEYRYLTEGLDGRRWQVLAIKQKFITAFLKADASVRVIEGDAVSLDDDSDNDLAESLSAAAGDPRIMLREKLKSDVQKLQNRERMHSQGVSDARQQVTRLERMVESGRSASAALRSDAEHYAAEREKPFRMVVDGKAYTKRPEAEAALEERFDGAFTPGEWLKVGKIAGFEIEAQRGTISGFQVRLGRGTRFQQVDDWSGREHKERLYLYPSASLRSIEAQLRGLERQAEQMEATVREREASIVKFTQAAELPFGQAAALTKKRALLEQIEEDLSLYPVAAPSWLRTGAPAGVDVFLPGEGGEPRAVTVQGHRWGLDNWHVLVDDGEAVRPVPYTDLRDENNLPVFEAREFEPPQVQQAAGQAQGLPAAGGAARPTTPNGIAVGDSVEIEGFAGGWVVTRLMPPSDPAERDRLSAWRVEAEIAGGGHREVVDAARVSAAAGRFSRDASKEDPLEAKARSLAKYYSHRDWPDEDTARADMRRWLDENNQRYQGLFRATDLAVVDRLQFVRARGGKVKLKVPREPAEGVSVDWTDVLPRGADVPRVDWSSDDSADDGSEADIMRQYGRGRGEIYRAWVPIDEIPAPKGAGITKEGYPDLEPDNEFGWEEFQGGSRRGYPPAKVRIGPRGKVELMDGNHRVAWWREQGYTHIPVMIIDERSAVRASVEDAGRSGTGSTRASVLRELKASGYLADVERLLAAGVLELRPGAAAPAGVPGSAAAMWDPRAQRATVWFDRVLPGRAAGKVMHELGVHGGLADAGIAAMVGTEWPELVAALNALEKAGDPLVVRASGWAGEIVGVFHDAERAAARRYRAEKSPEARAAWRAAKRMLETEQRFQDEERMAYALEHYENLDVERRRSLSGRARSFIARLIAALRNWWRRSEVGRALAALGLYLRPSVADLAGLAREAIAIRAAGLGGVPAEGGAVRFGGRLSESRRAPVFFSALTRGVEGLKQEKAPGSQWAAMIGKLPGVKAEEIQWSGVLEWLQEQKGAVTRDDLVAYLKANEVRVEEVSKGGEGASVNQEIEDRLTADIERMADDARAPYWYEALREQASSEGVDLSDLSSAERLELLERAMPREDRVGDVRDNLGSEMESEIREEIEERAKYEEGFDATKYGQYQVPGGENYREVLLTLPASRQDVDLDFVDWVRRRFAWSRALAERNLENQQFRQGQERDYAAAGGKARDVIVSPQYRSNHWDEPNVLAHVRFNERSDADGKRVLFVEEVQSDWHQAGRKKGYQGAAGGSWEAKRVGDWVPGDASLGKWVVSRNGVELGWFKGNSAVEVIAEATARNLPGAQQVPDAPFKQSWPLLAMKRMIRYAAENGFDRIAWTPGAVQAERYDLSKQVDRIEVKPSKAGRDVGVWVKGQGRLDLGVNRDGVVEAALLGDESRPDLKGKGLDDVLGKEMAEKIMAAERKTTFEGDGLRLGGHGMVGFYDKVLPAEVGKYVKKWGAKVEWAHIADVQAPAIEITPAMRAAVIEEGQPLFTRERRASGPAGADLSGLEGSSGRSPDDRLRLAAVLDRGDFAKWWAAQPDRWRRQHLMFLTRDQLGDVSYDILPEIRDGYLKIARMLDADKNEVLQRVETFMEPWGAMARADKAGADALAEVMHAATLAGIDPSEPYRAAVDLKAALAAIRRIQANAAMAKVFTEKDAADINDLTAQIKFEMRRRREYAGLKAQFDALPAVAQSIFREVRDYHVWFDGQILDALEQRIKEASESPAAARELIAALRKQYEANRVEAPYFPLGRFGDYWVHYQEPERTIMEPAYRLERISAEEVLLAGRGARVMAGQLAAELTGRGKPRGRYVRGLGWIYPAKDEERVRALLGEALTRPRRWKVAGERYVEHLDSLAESQEYRAELARAGMTILGHGEQFEGFREIEGVSATFVQDVDALLKQAFGEQEAGKAVRDGLWQLYLKSMPDVSIRKHFIHRTKRKGFSRDALRANTKKGFHDAYHLARLRHVYRMEREIEGMRDGIELAGNVARQGPLRRELAKLEEYQALRGRVGLNELDRMIAKAQATADAFPAGPAGARVAPEKAAALREVAKLEEFRRWFKRSFDPSRKIALAQRKLAVAKRLEEAGDEGKYRATSFVNELQDFHQLVLNPEDNGPVVQAINSLGFAWHLGLAPISAAVNVFQTVQMAMPMAAAKYGPRDTAIEFGRALRQFMASLPGLRASGPAGAGRSGLESPPTTGATWTLQGTLQGDELRALLEFQRRGITDKTFSHDLAGVAEEGVDYTGRRHRFMKAVSWLFHTAERLNREVTLMAVYRMERQRGASHADAIERAVDLTQRAHGNYDADNRARFMRGGWQRVAFQFKQYAQLMTYANLWAFRQAFKGASADERAEARRALVGMLAVQALFSGAMGMPWGIFAALGPTALYGPKGTAATAAAALVVGLSMLALADPDDPFDFEREWKYGLQRMGAEGAAAFGAIEEEAMRRGRQFERLIDRGLTGVIPWALSGRISLNDLWLRTPDLDMDEQKTELWVLKQLAGPVVGDIFLKVLVDLPARLAEAAATDDPRKAWLAVESNLPAGLRAPARAARLAGEGARDYSGNEVVPAASAAEVAGQALGAPPQRMVAQQEENALDKNRDAALQKRRKAILEKLGRGVLERDAAARDEALAAARRFSQKNPEYGISKEGAEQSVRATAQRKAQTQGGLYLPRKRAGLRGAFGER